MLWNKRNIITVVIPVHNGFSTIERALASMISNAEYIREVIIIDDASTDNTKKIVDKYARYRIFPIRYFRNAKCHGAGYSRREGMYRAKSEWITFVDADDCISSGSLRYVYEQINEKENKDMKILHCMTAYYESGTFNEETIGYSDTSCGGNFYRLDYLLENGLVPHDTLPLVEDQYFNEKIMYFMDYIDSDRTSNNVGHFHYPVYEVHHDINDGKSLAIRNWEDYCCKYRLLYKQYLAESLIGYLDDESGYDISDEYRNDMMTFLHLDYVTNFMFAYCLSCCMEYDEDLEFSIDDNLDYFRDALEFNRDVLGSDDSEIISLFENDSELFSGIIRSARDTTGIGDEIVFDFEGFMGKLKQV